jgi:hypothetical protein
MFVVSSVVIVFHSRVAIDLDSGLLYDIRKRSLGVLDTTTGRVPNWIAHKQIHSDGRGERLSAPITSVHPPALDFRHCN